MHATLTLDFLYIEQRLLQYNSMSSVNTHFDACLIMAELPVVSSLYFKCADFALKKLIKF